MYSKYMYILLVILFTSIAFAEYSIYEPTIPSYLEHQLLKVATPIFPGEDLIVRVSMSHIGGILLYSVDANDNQLIGMLDGGAKPTLTMIFRLSGSRVIQLASLCSCQRSCLNEVLKFTIKIQSVLYISCNDGLPEIIEFSQTKNFRENFPIIKFEKTASNQAKLWVANHPAIQNTFPNSAQMIGCIIDVTYVGSPLSMTVGGKARNGCARSCPLAGGAVCRGGACLETYSKDVICDCTSAKLAGPFCNESSPLKNLNYTLTVDVSAVKISWDQNNLQMFELLNKNQNITVNAVQSEIVFPQWPLVKFSMTGSHNRLHVLVIEFQSNKVNITLFPEKLSYQVEASVRITRAAPVHIAVQSRNGQLDVSYRQTKAAKNWEVARLSATGTNLQRTVSDRKVNKLEAILAKVNVLLNGDRVAGKSGTTLQGRLDRNLIILVFLFIAIIVIIIIVSILLCRNPRRQRNTNTTEADIPLRPLEDPPATVTPATCPRVTDPHQMSTNPEAEPLYQPQISTGNDEQMALSTLPSMGPHGNGNGQSMTSDRSYGILDSIPLSND